MAKKAEASTLRKRGQGEGSIFQRSDGLWVAAISTPEGRKVRYAKTRVLAAQKLQELQAQAAGGLPEARRDIAVEQLCEEYLAEKKPTWSPQSYQSAEQHVRLHVVPHLGKVKLASLDGRTVAAWLRKMPKARHTQLAREHLSAACALAVRWEWIQRNPVELTEQVKRERKPPPEISPDTLRAILEATKDTRHHGAVCLMLGCGLRVSETCGLCWSDWDEEKGVLKIERQMLILTGEPPALSPLKTRSSRRTVTVPAFATEALQRRRDAQREERAEREAKGKPWGNEWGLIFTGLGGKPIRSQGIGDTTNEALKAAGLKPIALHSLRHAFASVMIDSGMPITEVAHALGHATPAVTMQVYAHKLAGKPSQTASIMDGLVGK